MQKRLGIVGSWEKGPNEIDISLEKFLSMGEVEVYCPWSDYLFPSKVKGMPVVLEKGSISWAGKIIEGRIGVLSDMFTPKEFLESVGKNPVGVYIVRLDKETPANENIIGAAVESN